MVLIGMEGWMMQRERMTKLSVSINRGWAVKSKPKIPVPYLFIHRSRRHSEVLWFEFYYFLSAIIILDKRI